MLITLVGQMEKGKQTVTVCVCVYRNHKMHQPALNNWLDEYVN